MTVGDTTVSPVRHIRLRSAVPAGIFHETVDGLPTVSLIAAAIDIARTLHPLQAFYDVSMIMRHLSGFDRRDLAGSRRREEAIRRLLLDHLETLPGSKGTERARWTIRRADAGIESPGEAIVLWLLCLILPRGTRPQTQFPVPVGGRTYYGDVCLPGQRLDFEIHGKGKFGASNQEKDISIGHFQERHNALSDAGWRIVNVAYEDTLNLPRLVRYICREIDRAGVRSRPPPSWARLDDPAVGDHRRRF